QYTHDEAQRVLRDIQWRTVIPRNVYDNIHDLLEKLEKEKDPLERSKPRREVANYIMSARQVMYDEGMFSPIDLDQTGKDATLYDGLPNLYVFGVDSEYDVSSMTGIGLSKEHKRHSIIWG